MFDPVTAALLRLAPALPGLDPSTLPQTLTQRFAELVARRLRGGESGDIPERGDEGAWPLTRIADTYELITSIHEDHEIRRAAAFVAGTAQQILAQEAVTTGELPGTPVLTRDRVDAALAASILFLAAEQYADASDAARQIRIDRQGPDLVVTLLAESIRDLAAGKLRAILDRAVRRPERFVPRGQLETRATAIFFESLLVGIELFAAESLGEPVPVAASGKFDNAGLTFLRIMRLSSNVFTSEDPLASRLTTTYPGPRHLASLLLAAYDATAGSAVTKIAPPPGIDDAFWKRWLRHRAESAPFVWPNHRDAIAKGFHLPGKSAVLVLPTGAGKTTVSCLKIASVLAAGKKVVFIAPTHALVDQLTADLQEAFPEELLQSAVSSSFDLLFASGSTLRKIEVMTPERCLALLSHASDAFASVGLMVFDECHLLSPVSGLRRALDGMFCVLAFNSIAPDADFLFLSAMVRNGTDFGAWISSLTGRDCVVVELLWKPSRQARGVVLYREEAIQRIHSAALRSQRQVDSANKRAAKGLRTAARAELLAEPFALFGLQSNWLHEKTADCAITRLSDGSVPLNGKLQGRHLFLLPNVNEVAANIATASVLNGLKCIVFVNVKSQAVSTARKIAAALNSAPQPTSEEIERWNALDAELGGLDHSLLEGPAAAVPHNAQMLRLERDLAERMFRRIDGAQVIVATPTLAQGLNLPAHLAILASDMRADPEEGGREALAAHEILNAAARAGRAGHLANGVVLLIPEAVLTFSNGKPLDFDIIERLRSVLPQDDRCLDLNDPLQTVLDRISQAATDDPDVEYALNRFSTAVAPEGAESEVTTRFSMDKSFAAFMAARRDAASAFTVQIARLKEVLSRRRVETEDRVLLELAARSGAPVAALSALRGRLLASAESVPGTISEWVAWVLAWLAEDEQSRLALLGRDRQAMLGAVGRKKDSPLSPDVMRELLPGLLAWLEGKPLCEIEKRLGGDPAGELECPRARHLVTGVVPQGLSFLIGLVTGAAKEIVSNADRGATPESVLDCLPVAVRRGFDTPSKVAFAEVRKGLYGRVQFHRAYEAEVDDEFREEANTLEYGSLVGKMRAHLGSAERSV